MESIISRIVKLLCRMVIYVSLGVLMAPSVAMALTSGDIQSLIEQHPYYDPAATSCGSGGAIALTGNDSIEQAYIFFIQKGLSPSQSAGVVGNMKWKSGLDPQNIQN